MMPTEKLEPVHPGEVLLEEFLRPLGLSQNKLALGIGVHPRRVNEIVLQKRGMKKTIQHLLKTIRIFFLDGGKITGLWCLLPALCL